jgi:hypothetical protein
MSLPHHSSHIGRLSKQCLLDNYTPHDQSLRSAQSLKLDDTSRAYTWTGLGFRWMLQIRTGYHRTPQQITNFAGAVKHLTGTQLNGARSHHGERTPTHTRAYMMQSLFAQCLLAVVKLPISGNTSLTHRINRVYYQFLLSGTHNGTQ